MTTTPITGPSTGPGTAPPPAGSIARLNPFDGLFLRAEHLGQMQAYTRELTRALGRAGGPGVVYGCGISVQDGAVEVTAGLAIDPAGRPLLLADTVRRPLGSLTVTTSELVVVELVARETSFGDETVYGALCDDPCDGAAGSTRPYVIKGVDIQLRNVRLSGMDGPALERRSRAASAWFENERKELGALLRTSDRDKPDATLADFRASSWEEPTGPPGGNAVGVGVLLPVEGGGWDADAWIARRDRIDSPPRRAWQGRLGMRPWDVFIAQVLQFQVQLAGRWPQASAALQGLASTKLALSELDEAAEVLRTRHTKRATELVSAAAALLRGRIAPRSDQGLLVDHGFVELPPAGYLPLSGGDVVTEVTAMFNATVELRFCTCRPDYVAHAVEEAQHLDRIRLTGGEGSQVDILVPGGELDGDEQDGTLTTAYNWVGFHRRRDRDCGPVQVQVDLVEVHSYEASNAEDFAQVVRNLEAGQAPAAAASVEASYPVDAWALPAPEVQAAVRTWTTDASRVAVVGLARSAERRPLAGVRAALLVSTFEADTPAGGAIVRTALVAPPRPEAIWVIALKQPL
jgi:hypothetical protein